MITVNSKNLTEVVKNIPIEVLRIFIESPCAYGIDDKISILKDRMYLQSEELYKAAAIKTVDLYWISLNLIEVLNTLSAEELRLVLLAGDGKLLIDKGVNILDVARIIHNSPTYAYFYDLR